MKLHLHLPGHDLAASTAFYQTLLGAEPVKNYPDYALFITEEPGLELAISVDCAAIIDDSMHYGIAVDEPEAVESASARLRAAGYAVEIETAETCCYAQSNKVWATDPDGRRWETYVVLAESEPAETTVCC